MPSIQFRGARIKHFVMQEAEAGHFVRATMAADLSDTVIEKMGWSGVLLDDSKNFREGWDSMHLTGNLTAEKFILTPNGTELKRFGLELAADTIDDFQAVKIDGAEGKGTKYELRFKLRTSADLAEGKIGSYWRKIGGGIGLLKVGYSEQAELPLEPGQTNSDEMPEVAAGSRRKKKEAATEITQ